MNFTEFANTLWREILSEDQKSMKKLLDKCEYNIRKKRILEILNEKRGNL